MRAPLETIAIIVPNEVEADHVVERQRDAAALEALHVKRLGTAIRPYRTSGKPIENSRKRLLRNVRSSS